MADRPHVPKFGNWESQQNVPYTVFFDKARKNRTGAGKIINPNDPQESPDLFSNHGSPARAPPTPKPKLESEEPVGQKPVKRTHDQVKGRENGGFKPFPGSPAPSENANQRGDQRYGGRGVNLTDTNKRMGAPENPQARNSGWEGNKGSYHNSSHGSAGERSRPSRPIPNHRGQERVGAIPKFGGWEHNPSTADGYTHIFDKAREDKYQGGRIPGSPLTPSRPVNHRQSPPNSPKTCCFPWSRKREY